MEQIGLYEKCHREVIIKKLSGNRCTQKLFDNVNYFRDFYDWFKTEEDIELRGLRENPEYKNPKLNCVRTALERMIKGYSNFKNRVGTGQNGDDECRWGRSSD